MALRNLPDGKRLGDSLRALEDIQRRADSLIAGYQNGGAETSPDEAATANGSTPHEDHAAPTDDTILEVELRVDDAAGPAAEPKPQSNGATTAPATSAAPADLQAKPRDPFLDSLDALRRTLRNGSRSPDNPAARSARKIAPASSETPGPASEPTASAVDSAVPEVKPSEPAPKSTVDEVSPAIEALTPSEASDESVSALELVPLPEVERSPTPLPQREEAPRASKRKTPAPPPMREVEQSMDNALDAVRQSVGLPKAEDGRSPSTPRPRKRRPMSDGIPKSVSEDLPKFHGKPRMRICNRCGHETRLREPECRNCGKVDESLGILDAVISGDLSKVEQILLVRPHLIGVQTNRHAWTLLHMAASGGNKKMTELLISKGAAVNATNRDGKTPLHYAAGKGHLNVVETLIAHHADPETKYNGKIAADLAHEHHQYEIETYLRNLKRD